jgi:hypothetical protein
MTVALTGILPDANFVRAAQFKKGNSAMETIWSTQASQNGTCNLFQFAWMLEDLNVMGESP